MLAGRGVRSFLDLDYSYDPATYHPLGLKLFSAKIKPPRTHLREIIEENPRPRTFAAPEPAPPVAEKERTFFSDQEGGEALGTVPRERLETLWETAKREVAVDGD